MTGPRVLIVGGGIAGLAVARVLQGRDVHAELVERMTEWPTTGAGLYLPANGVRALHQLGVGAEVEARANPIARQTFRDHRGQHLATVDVDRLWQDVGRCVAIRRTTLHELLLQASARTPIRLGTEVTAIEDMAAPRVSFSDGSAETYDLVVGADGVHSTTRQLALDGPPAAYVGQASWRFVADGSPDVSDWTVMLGRGRAFLAVALGQGAVYCYADIDTGDPSGVADKDVRRQFADFAEPVPSLLEHAAEAHFAPVEEVIAPLWTGGRIVLVGDAAHASSPNMAQGAAMAVEDALVLGEMLTSNETIDEALTAYTRRRRTRVAWVQEQTHRRDRTRGLPAVIRNVTLRLAGERIFRSNYAPLHDLP